MELKGPENNVEGGIEAERRGFEENLDRLGKNVEEFLERDESSASDELMRYFKNPDNLAALLFVLGPLGTSLSDTLASRYLPSNLEILRNDPALQDAIKAIGIGPAVAKFREQISKQAPRLKRLLGGGA